MYKFRLDGVMGKKYVVQLPTHDIRIIKDFQVRFDKSMKEGYPFLMLTPEIKIYEVKGKRLKSFNTLWDKLKSKFNGGKK